MRSERPTVACIEWIEPLMAGGNWTPELIDMAGGVNLFGEAGKHSGYFTWDELERSDPDVIVISPCGFDIERTVQEMHWLTDRPAWHGLRAVRQDSVYLADGNLYFNRPGPRLVETLEILAEILHLRASRSFRVSLGEINFSRVAKSRRSPQKTRGSALQNILCPRSDLSHKSAYGTPFLEVGRACPPHKRIA